MLKVTSHAAEQIIKAAEQGNMVGLALRIAAQYNHSDGSIGYIIGFDEIREEDVHVNSHGVDIVFSQEHKELLQGAVIDYVEMEPGDFRFIFLNPNDPTYIPPAGF